MKGTERKRLADSWPALPSANTIQIAGGHYVSKPVQVWDFIHRNGIGYLAGNVIKYVSRYREKGGIADLEKARHYIEKLIEEEKATRAASGAGEP